jgi:hypothetical protein
MYQKEPGMKRTLPALLLACAVAFTGTGAQAKPDKAHQNNGRHVGQLRRLPVATLGDSQIVYALGHEQQSIARLRSMRNIDASKVRIIRLTPAQKARFHVSMLSGGVAYQPFTMLDSSTNVAQIFNTNNPLLQQLQQLIAGMLVTNAINNTLGGSNGGGATATLAQILLSNGIPLSSLLGVFFDPSGILNAIVG